ncbi:MAG: asparagine synthase (glutamine-hydrolyzing) [Methylacidiphilales bacterium]|nr:asparagine synthase (glutamine-hydrolyzing) [Candidatus Methylacidiphilales bacterium]
MCGIAGFFDAGLTRVESRSLLEGMLDRMRHRGPDGEGLYQDARIPVQFGMRRLGIIDLPGGTQPIWNERHDVAVIFNGEIYNYKELRVLLEGRGHHFKTQTDTEVLVHLYEESEDKLVGQLRGMFAFCILDLKKSRLLLARDHFGQKPLYYHVSPGHFAFASEIKALLALPFVGSTLNPEALPDYLTWHSLPAPATHFKEIQKLGPGEILAVSLAPFYAGKPQRYWRMEFGGSFGGIDYQTAIEMLDSALMDSTHRHMQADVPVGVLLSSGVDSCTLANYAYLSGKRNLSSFTVGFEDSDSELGGARKVSEMLGMQHFETVLKAKDLEESIDEVAWHLDEPVADPAAFAVLRICQLASRHVTVLFGGEGSDELLAGYGQRYAGISATLKRSDFLRKYLGLLVPPGRPFPTSRWDRMRKRISLNRAAELVSLRAEGLPGNFLHPACWNREQQEWFLERCNMYGGSICSQQPNPVQDAQMFDISWQLPEFLLQKADKMSMAASVELRCPFLDMEVAEIASRIPSEMLIDVKNGSGKLLLRSCLARRMPHAADTPKNGFAFALAYWLRGKLRPAVEHDLFCRDAAYRDYLDPLRVRKAWNRFLAGEELSHVFYSLWLYERWNKIRPRFQAHSGLSPHLSTDAETPSQGKTAEKPARIRVIVAPDYREANPYQQLLGNAMEQDGADLIYLKHYRRVLPLFRMVRLYPGALLHLHWPEAYYSARGGVHTFIRRLRFPLDLKLAGQKCRIILTAHNLWPHDTEVDAMVLRNMTLCYKNASAVIAHSPAAAGLVKDEFELPGERIFVIPHGDLSVAYGQPGSQREARRTLGFGNGKLCLMLGAVAPYKGIEEVVEWWKQYRPDVTLAIVGACGNPAYLAQLKKLADDTPSILLREGRLNDLEVATWLDAADAVLCNYRRILTSGAACLARSWGLPVLLPSRCHTVDLMEPHPLVLRYDDMDEHFDLVLSKAVSLGGDYELSKEWRQYTSWERVGAETRQVYEIVRDENT